MKTQTIDISKLKPGENSRIDYKKEDLKDLMSSIKKEGILQPIGVRVISKDPTKHSHEIIYGFRRFFAAEKLGWASIPCVVHNSTTTDQTALILNLTENFQRRNTTIYEDGRAFNLLQDLGLKPGEIATRLGITSNRVQTALDATTVFTKSEQKQIVHSISGGHNKRRGVVAGATAAKIINMRKSGLSRKDASTLFKAAAEGKITRSTLMPVADLMEAGQSLSKALKWGNNTRLVTVKVMIKENQITKLERKYGKNINIVLADKICAMRELDGKVIPANARQWRERPDFAARNLR